MSGRDVAPLAKRKRTDDPRAEAPPVRSKIWMPYGDIIIQADATQFRVNRDILAQHSSVFSDMFSVPQPPNEPTVEGCPIVHVSDAAKDWELLFEVLYDPFTSKVVQPFPVLAAMLRLGRKYDFRKAKEDAIARIHSEFPSTFQEWEATPDNFVHIQAGDYLLIELFNLAFECGILTSIPALGMSCLDSYTLQDLFEGSNGGPSVATDQAKLALALAVERIVNFQRRSMAWLDGDKVVPHISCKSKDRCRNSRISLHGRRALYLSRARKLNVSCTIDEWGEYWSGELCSVCEAAAKDHYEATRRKGWDLLPTFFGLPPWQDLRDLD